jgi:peptidoglycan/LPS O-acetylase OafA/YrhL
VAPTYGSNGPLWSLANEFWYYLVFPLAAAALFVSSPLWQRLAVAATAVVLALILPWIMVLLGLIWVAGAAAHHLSLEPRLRPYFGRLIYVIAATGFVAGCIVLRANDLLLGLAWAALLPGLAVLSPMGGIYAWLAGRLADISYTLYATHFPLLAFLWFTAIAPVQWSPGPKSLALGLASLVLTLGYATAVWWCFERNTARIRTAMLRRLERPRSADGSAAVPGSALPASSPATESLVP